MAKRVLKIDKAVALKLVGGTRVDISFYNHKGKAKAVVNVSDAKVFVQFTQQLLMMGLNRKHSMRDRKKVYGNRAFDIKLSPNTYWLIFYRENGKAYKVERFELSKKQMRSLKSKSKQTKKT